MNIGKGQTADPRETAVSEVTQAPVEPILRPEEPLRNPFLTEE
jgi:hypothetical protein